LETTRIALQGTEKDLAKDTDCQMAAIHLKYTVADKKNPQNNFYSKKKIQISTKVTQIVKMYV